MNFRNLVVKLLCKRMLIDFNAQPEIVGLGLVNVELEEHIHDIYRAIRGHANFNIVFSDHKGVKVTFGLEFTDECRQYSTPTFVKGLTEEYVKIFYPKDYKLVTQQWTEELVDEILCYVEQFKSKQFNEPQPSV